jgi:hypothetical protein
LSSIALACIRGLPQEVIRSRFFCATAEWLAAFQRNDPRILPDEEILMALRNSSGPRPTLFIPEQVRSQHESLYPIAV